MKTNWIAPWAALLALALLAPAAVADDTACGPGAGFSNPDTGDELIGKPAPPWAFSRWVGPALSQEKLRGKVVLLRWWNVDCHFCEATLPEIEMLRHRYARDGFEVIGVFHPKPPHPVRNADVKRAAAKRGFFGPLAIDEEWETLSRYWLAGNPERNWTSVSFLIDRDGKIAWVHGGGEYHRTEDPRHKRCDLRARDLEATLERLFGRGAPPDSAARP